MSLRVCEQGDCHCVCVLAELFADELGSAEHVRPLIVAAELHIAAVMLEEVIEVV